jgi:hypothetical protein
MLVIVTVEPNFFNEPARQEVKWSNTVLLHLLSAHITDSPLATPLIFSHCASRLIGFCLLSSTSYTALYDRTAGHPHTNHSVQSSQLANREPSRRQSISQFPSPIRLLLPGGSKSPYGDICVQMSLRMLTASLQQPTLFVLSYCILRVADHVRCVCSQSVPPDAAKLVTIAVAKSWL